MKKQIGMLVLVIGVAFNFNTAIANDDQPRRNKRCPTCWISNPHRHYENMLRQRRRAQRNAFTIRSGHERGGWWSGGYVQSSCSAHW